MTDPEQHQPATTDSKLIRVAIWVAIGALIAAAIVCVVWVIIGNQSGLIGRAFLTVLLLAAFAGVAILDAHLAANRPPWFALASMTSWVVALLLGVFLVWMPSTEFGHSIQRFLSFLLIVLVLQLALLHIRLIMKAHDRNPTTFIRATTYITIGLVLVLAGMLVFALAFDEFFTFHDAYWRWVVAITILAAVGTALVPLVNALFAPRRPRAVRRYAEYTAAAQQAWPTYADGVTPLPVMPDGTPDWNAYYTGYPTAAPQLFAPTPPVALAADPYAGYYPGPDAAGAPPAYEPQAPEPQQYPEPAQPTPPTPPGYEGYPPPPPLPR